MTTKGKPPRWRSVRKDRSMLYDVRIHFQKSDGQMQCSTRLVEALSVQDAHNKAVATAADEVRCHLQDVRSEEHTSELQSLMRISYAVFCLKKKKNKEKKTHQNKMQKKKAKLFK